MTASRQLTAVNVQSDISRLRCLRGMLETNGINTRDDFFEMMVAVFAPGNLELRALSDDLGFSFSTVFRWQERRSAPHASLWPRIVEWVLTSLLTRIRERERDLEHV